MSYYIGYLPSEEFQVFYRDVIKDISQRFQLEKLPQKRRIPHITLKSPFEISSPQSLDKLIAVFCQNQRTSQITINGIGSFGKEVIFLHSQPSEQMISTFGQLLDNLRGIEGMSWNEYDTQNKTLHITLAKEEELKGKFQNVYDYLSTQEIRFVLPFDNITLFQKDGGRTSAYRTYYLRKCQEVNP